MKPLIRPFLFAAGRLSLFLAVAGFIIGQWWICSCSAGILNSTVTIDLTDRGIIVRYSTFRAIPWKVEATRFPSAEQIQFVQYAFDESFIPKSGFGGGTTGNRGFGYVYTNNGFMRILAVRHPLIICIFVVFNLSLHLIFRRRAEAQSCEN